MKESLYVLAFHNEQLGECPPFPLVPPPHNSVVKMSMFPSTSCCRTTHCQSNARTDFIVYRDGHSTDFKFAWLNLAVRIFLFFYDLYT